MNSPLLPMDADQKAPRSAYLMFVPLLVAVVLFVVNTACGGERWWLVCVNGFFWCWGVVNTVKTKALDGGVVSFFAGMVAGIMELCKLKKGVSGLAFAGSILVLLNFVAGWKVMTAEFAEKNLHKTGGWARIFRVYCLLSALYWAAAVVVLGFELQ